LIPEDRKPRPKEEAHSKLEANIDEILTRMGPEEFAKISDNKEALLAWIKTVRGTRARGE
jgi:hypothetical protein